MAAPGSSGSGVNARQVRSPLTHGMGTVENARAISGRPNERKPNARKARVPPPPPPYPEPSGRGASVDIDFHKGWYFLSDVVQGMTCEGVAKGRFLPQMAQVEDPLPYPNAFNPKDTIKVMAEKLMPLLHKVMHHKQLHTIESMQAVHEMEDGIHVAPHGCWQFMWPVKKASSNNAPERTGWQMYECYTINTAKTLRLGRHVAGFTHHKHYLNVLLGFGRHPTQQRVMIASKRLANRRCSVGEIEEGGGRSAGEAGCVESSGKAGERGGNGAGCDAEGGSVQGGGTDKKFKVLEGAHRLVLFFHKGPPPSEKKTLACHECDTPQCLCPAHLKWGDAQHNHRANNGGAGPPSGVQSVD